MKNDFIATQVIETQLLWSGVRRAEVMQQIRRIMREKKLTGKDMASRTGFHHGSISRMLTGSDNIPIDTLYKLADALQEPLIITFGNQNDEDEYEIYQNDECVAGASGKGALQEILLYAAQYSLDGPVELFKVTRTLISKLP